jgi:hypothetical protein
VLIFLFTAYGTPFSVPDRVFASPHRGDFAHIGIAQTFRGLSLSLFLWLCGPFFSFPSCASTSSDHTAGTQAADGQSNRTPPA